MVPEQEPAAEPSPAPEADQPEADQPVHPEAPAQPEPSPSAEAPVPPDQPARTERATAAQAEPAPEAPGTPAEAEPLKRGDIVEATVRRLAPFGAFVQLASGRKGLIHISQIAEEYVTEIKDHVKVGDIVRARITAVSEDGKVDLSIKKAKPRPKPPRAPRAKHGKRPEPDRPSAKALKAAKEFRVNPLADQLGDVEKRLPK